MSAVASRWTRSLLAAALLTRLAGLEAAGCSARARRDAVDADVAAAGSVGLLQYKAGPFAPSDNKHGSKGLKVSHDQRGAPAAGKQPERKHYWPHARGDVDHYSQTPFKIPMDFNESLLWKWDALSYNTILWGASIDADRNLYVSGLLGVYKLSPEGKQLWYAPVQAAGMPTLVGDRLVGMQVSDAMAYSLDLKTGKPVWMKTVRPDNGAHGVFAEVHNGVAVVGMGASDLDDVGGTPSVYVGGVDIENGNVLWNFSTDCGLRNVMALFPDEDTTIFNDQCGSVYRLGLRNGTKLWKSLGGVPSSHGGGSMLGPDGSIYTCSSPPVSSGLPGSKGLLRKHRLSDGKLLWGAGLDYPCVNFPAASADGRTVIVAPGGLSGRTKTTEAGDLPPEQREGFYRQQAALVANGTQRSHYNLSGIEAALLAFDAETGELQWRHDVRPYAGIAFAGDELRSWRHLSDPWFNTVPYCSPAHWSAPTVDPDGRVIIGRSSGEFIAYDPKRGVETAFRTGDGTRIAGAAFAPGIMAITTCSSLYVFKIPDA